MFTGLRLNESRTLRWQDIDLNERVIRIPAAHTKAGRKLDLPMSDFVRDLLVARRAIGNAGFVFPGPGETGHLMDALYQLSLVADACGIRVSTHDLRRTYITVAESCDISPLALKALVNHSMGRDVTAGYVQISVERLREPTQRVANKLKELCGIAALAGENVAQLR